MRAALSRLDTIFNDANEAKMRDMYLRWVAALSAGASCWGATTVTVNKQDVTATQAIIRVVTNQAGYCTYRVSEGSSFTDLVNDVNPNLFAGANLDSRLGSIISGIEAPNLRQFAQQKEHVFVVGSHTAPLAPDGKHYSRSLQANTLHWVGVTCGTDAEVSTTFTTLNPPLGNDEPELMPFDRSSFGNVQVPSIKWADRTAPYNDPVTGIQLHRMTDPS